MIVDQHVQCRQEGFQVCSHERPWMPSSHTRINPARRVGPSPESLIIDSLVRVRILLGELRHLGKDRELRDYAWWSAQDAADYADGQLAEALRQLRAGELGEEYAPSDEDLAWARRKLSDPASEEPR